MRLTARTYVPAVQQQPMMCICCIFCRDVSHKFTLNFKRRVGLTCYKSEPVAHTEHMRVNGNDRTPESYGLNDIGRLAPHSRQFINLSIVSGTSPLKSDISIRAMLTRCCDLALGYDTLFIYS